MKNNPNEEKILDAALKVVARETISGTRTRMIAEEAGMTASNLHYYYKNKEDILGKLQERVMAEGSRYRHKGSGDRPPKNLDEALDMFFLQKMDFIVREKEYDFVHMDFWLQARVDEGMRESIARNYENWRAEVKRTVIDPFAGEISEFDKNRLSYVIISLLQGASIQYHLESFNLPGYFSYCKLIINKMLTESMEAP